MHRCRAGGGVGPVATGVACPLHEEGDPQRVLDAGGPPWTRGPSVPEAASTPTAGTRSSASPTVEGLIPPASVTGTSRATAAASAVSTRIPVPPGWGPPAASSRIRVAPAAQVPPGVRDDRVGVRARGDAQRLPDRTRCGGDGGRRLVAAHLDRVGIDGRDDLGQARRRQVRGDGDDRRAAAGPGGPRQAGQRDPLFDGQLTRRAGREVEPDGVRAGADRGEHPGGVRHAAHLDARGAVVGGEVGGVPAGRHERRGHGLRVAGTHQRLADQRGVEPGRPPASDGRGVANAGLRDGQPVAGDRVPERDGPLRVHVQRPEVPVVDPDDAGVRTRAPTPARGRRAPPPAAPGQGPGPARRAGRAAWPGGARRGAGRGRPRQPGGGRAAGDRRRTPWPGPARRPRRGPRAGRRPNPRTSGARRGRRSRPRRRRRRPGRAPRRRPRRRGRRRKASGA